MWNTWETKINIFDINVYSKLPCRQSLVNKNMFNLLFCWKIKAIIKLPWQFDCVSAWQYLMTKPWDKDWTIRENFASFSWTDSQSFILRQADTNKHTHIRERWKLCDPSLACPTRIPMWFFNDTPPHIGFWPYT